jgi:hypothetical protein
MSSIFLSHNHRDKPFARQLSERLQAHGIRTWIDEAEIRVGDSLISKIEAAVREFTYLGVILSPNPAPSEWVRREVNIALTEEIQGRRVKVLPLLYKECEIPAFLADKLYADFTGDFEEGFEKLLARLTSDLHEEKHKQKRAAEILQAAYQDWVSFGKQDHQLLSRDAVVLVLQHLVQPKLSLDLMEYLFSSVSYLPESEKLDLSRLKDWLSEIETASITELFDRLLNHPNPRVRLGAMTLVRHLAEMRATDVVMTEIGHEGDCNVRRAGLQTMLHLGRRLPNELARSLLHTDEDWLVRSYALLNLDGYRPALLISDGTEFATELGTMAESAGFNVVTLSPPTFFQRIAEAEDEVLNAYELLILVRGEHFSQSGNEDAYSKLRRFVAEGGSLFATSWVSWETKFHHEFANVLPFVHVRDTYEEDVTVTCKPLRNELAQKLFPNQIS